MIGTSLHHYQITGQLGAGGMGEVFRARDTRLNRDVAVKVLPKEFATDEGRLRRFENEARTLAALNHPNILSIFDTGVHDGAPYLVSELLEGQTLREALRNGALSQRKAIEYALQIAHGLAAAHTKGIVHRDLKPENIFVTNDGRVKILDFGLAKLKENPKSEIRNLKSVDPEAATLAASTAPGMVLGTVGYMSPEQVRSADADHRSDIFSFGAIFYEMLSGQRAFRKETSVQTMNAILTEEPLELAESNPNLSPALERLMRRCLEKQPENRFQSAKDLAFAIENAGASSTSSLRSMAGSAAQARFSFQRVLPWAVAILGIVAALWVLFAARTDFRRSHASKNRALLRKFELSLPAPTKRSGDSSDPALALSPDGQKLAYRNADGLWVLWLDRLGPPLLLVSGDNLSRPFWSPHSSEVAYFEGRKLNRISITGGRPILICFAPEKGGSGAWFPDDRICFTTGWSGLHQVFAKGGEASVVARTAEGEQDFHNASALPEGRGVLFVVHRDKGIDTIAVWERGGSRKIVLQIPGAEIWGAVYSPSGHVLFERKDFNRGLWAVPFSLAMLKVTGEPFRVTDEGSGPSVADDGTIVYCPSSTGFFEAHQLVWVDRTGQMSGTVGSAQVGLHQPQLSPDGRAIAAVAGETLLGLDISVFDIEKGNQTRVTKNNVADWYPFWFPDGRRVLFTQGTQAGTSPRVMAKTVEGFGGEEQIADGWCAHVGKSGKYVLVGKEKSGLAYLALADAAKNPVAFPRGFQNVKHSKLSPDDRFLAYWSGEAGEDEIYVVAFPAFTSAVRISRAGGRMPYWHPKGSELFYVSLDGRSMMSASVKGAELPQFGEPTKLFDLPESISTPNGSETFDVTADGQRFLMVQRLKDKTPASSASRSSVIFVENWFEEFREKK